MRTYTFIKAVDQWFRISVPFQCFAYTQMWVHITDLLVYADILQLYTNNVKVDAKRTNPLGKRQT